jgi:hypothetical protein
VRPCAWSSSSQVIPHNHDNQSQRENERPEREPGRDLDR